MSTGQKQPGEIADPWDDVVRDFRGARLAIYDDLERHGRTTIEDADALRWLCEHCLVELTPQGARVIGIETARRRLTARMVGAEPEAARKAPAQPVNQLRTPAVQMAPRQEKSGQLSFFGA